MRLPEIGYAIRRARRARRLTQAQLASAAGISRVTMNQLENGLFPDLGIRKVQAILDRLGLALIIKEAQQERADLVHMASTAASVSFKDALTQDELIHALLTGKIPAGKRPHMRALLEEASPALLRGLVDEVSGWSKPGRVQKNIVRIARDLGSPRTIDEWLKQKK